MPNSGARERRTGSTVSTACMDLVDEILSDDDTMLHGVTRSKEALNDRMTHFVKMLQDQNYRSYTGAKLVHVSAVISRKRGHTDHADVAQHQANLEIAEVECGDGHRIKAVKRRRRRASRLSKPLKRTHGN